MKRGSYLLIKRVALQEDSWTYGDWRQYLAFLDNGEAACVRMSQLPLYAALVGVVLLTCVGLGVWVAMNGAPVPQVRLAVSAFVGFLLIGPALVMAFTPWRLVKVVLTCTRLERGGWERNL